MHDENDESLSLMRAGFAIPKLTGPISIRKGPFLIRSATAFQGAEFLHITLRMTSNVCLGPIC